MKNIYKILITFFRKSSKVNPVVKKNDFLDLVIKSAHGANHDQMELYKKSKAIN